MWWERNSRAFDNKVISVHRIKLKLFVQSLGLVQGFYVSGSFFHCTFGRLVRIGLRVFGRIVFVAVLWHFFACCIVSLYLGVLIFPRLP